MNTDIIIVILYMVIQVMQNVETIFTKSAVQVKEWNVLHTLVKFITKSHL